MNTDFSMLTLATNPLATASGLSKSKSRSRLSSTSLSGLRNSSSRSLANLESRLAHFQRSDLIDGDYVISYLENHPEIEELICEEVISDQHIHAMHRLFVNYHTYIHLNTLELPNNSLTVASGEPLANILTFQQETIRKLNLSKNPLTGQGVSELLDPLTQEAHPSRLQILDLRETSLGSKGANAIAAILRDNTSIEELFLAHNNLGTKGTKTIAPALGTNSTLRLLDISFNNIKKNGAAALAQSLQQSRVSNLRILNVKCNNLGPPGLLAFTKLLAVDRRLEAFYVGGNGLGPEGASCLGNALKLNYTLKDLRLEDNQIGDDGARTLAAGLAEDDHRSSALERLGLEWNDIGLEGARIIAGMLMVDSTLVSVDLTGNSISCEGAEALAAALAYNLSLKKLVLTRNQIKDPGAYALVKAMVKPSCKLETLGWQENPLSDAGRIALERVPQLRQNLKYWFGQLLGDISKGYITNIDLKDRRLGDDELLLLTESLQQHNPTIRSFWLSACDLTARSLIPFIETVFTSRSRIMRLYMKHCQNGDDAAKAFSTVLPENTCLEVLSITDSKITSTGATKLSKGIRGNKTLRRLNLDRNQIGDEGVTALCQGLPESSLCSLSLSTNSLTDRVMACEAFKSLEELHLNGNGITDGGALELSRHIMHGSKLNWVSLRRNEISKRGGEALKIFLPPTAIVDF